MLGHTAISERAIGDASLGNDLFGASSQDLNFTQTTVGDLLFTEISPLLNCKSFISTFLYINSLKN